MTHPVVAAHERYAGANPLSAPFWHRCGYRPLWTSGPVRPAARLGPVTT